MLKAVFVSASIIGSLRLSYCFAAIGSIFVIIICAALFFLSISCMLSKVSASAATIDAFSVLRLIVLFP